MPLQAGVGAGGGSTAGRGAGGGGPAGLEFLRNHPQFQALRSVVQANPGILQPMLQVGMHTFSRICEHAAVGMLPVAWLL